MALNTTLSPTIIAREALRLLKNNLVMGNLVYRAYESEFPGNPKKGGTVTIRKPVKFTVTKARTRTSSVITENSITLSVDTQAHVSWAFETAQLQLTIEEYSERYLRPAAAALANQVDSDLLQCYNDVYNSVWVTGATDFTSDPNSFWTLAKAFQRLDEEAAPQEERVVVLNPAASWALTNALTNLYLPEPGTTALRKGKLGRLANCDVYMDQNVKVHQVGNYHDTASSTVAAFQGTGGTGTITGGVYCTSNKSSLIQLVCGTVSPSTALRQGDIFTVNDLFAVNPMSGQSTGVLRQFVVNCGSGTAAAISGVATTGTTTGHVTVTFEPAMVNTGPYKTVTTVPAAQAAVSFKGNPGNYYPQNLVFHKNAFALVFVPMEKPDGATWGASITEDGYSIRILKQYSIDADTDTVRLDILYGVKTIYPELAVRVWGKEAT